MSSERLSLRADEFGELHFFYRKFTAGQTDLQYWTISNLFAGALELFLTEHFCPDDICLRGGTLCIRNIDQQCALTKFVASGYGDVFCDLGNLFAQCRPAANPLSQELDAFFNVPWERHQRSTNPINREDAGAGELLNTCFRIYEAFTVCECFLLDLTSEAFLRGIHLPYQHLNEQAIRKILFGVPQYRIRDYEDAAPSAFCPKELSLPDGPGPETVPQDPFRMPSCASGWHSGWDEKQNDPCAALALAKRRTVQLAPHAAERTVTLAADSDVPPFLLKTPLGTVRGLSSGAGGALVEWRGNIFKLKRCGLKNEGIFLNAIRDRNISTAGDRLIETTISAPAGLAPLPLLEREAEVVCRLPEFGLEAASRPSVIYVIVKGDAPSGCLVSTVKSDLRVDEVLYGLACNHGGLLSRPKIHELVEELGAAEGALYSRIHCSGIVRGIGNSWYGNEALGSDGSLLLCDLETFFFPELVTLELSRFYRSHEKNFFHMAVWRSLAMLGDTGMDLTRRFLRAFQSTYERRAEILLPARGCAEWVRAVAERTGTPRIKRLPAPMVNRNCGEAMQ